MRKYNLSKEKQDIMNFFDCIAPIYDSIEPRIFRYFGLQLVKFADIPINCKLLDVAMGRGAVLFPALEFIGQQGQLTGIDLSPNMVNHVSKEIKNFSDQNIELYQMDAENLQFTENSFDVVFCAFAVYFFPNPLTAIKEMIRVLKPRGELIIATWSGKKPERSLTWLNNIIDSYSSLNLKKFNSLSKNYFNDPIILNKTMIESGLINIQVITSEYEIRYTEEEEFLSFIYSFPLKKIVDQINSLNNNDISEFRKKISEGYQLYKEDDGLHIKLRSLFTKGIKK